MYPDETDEEDLEKLAEDNQRPFTPADDQATGGTNLADDSSTSLSGDNQQITDDASTVYPNDGTLDDTHPATDTNMQREELYDEGVSGAAEASDPNSKF